MHLSGLACSECGHSASPASVTTTCTQCGGPLLAHYDLAHIRAHHERSDLEKGATNLWRFAPLLPVEAEFRITLGEGMTPLLATPKLAKDLGLRDLRVKDEGLNPTGTFKARGLCVAVAKALELGVRTFAIPTAGNAGVALAAYAAAANVEAHVFVPEDAPRRVIENASALGAHVTLIKGLISDAGAACRAFVQSNPGVMDVSTMREPYRVEGKKTMGLEIALDLGWTWPDVIVYPTGGGTGIAGMAKAFRELSTLGWVHGTPPRLVSVQADGCAPVVRAIESGATKCEFWANASTSAAGLRVPKPFADALILRDIRETKGTAVAVPESAIHREAAVLAKEGILASPEGGAALAGLRALVERGEIRRDDRVVLFNTGSALAY
ncbi:MAG: threonine synthase [Thermoplasmatota archaeon]